MTTTNLLNFFTPLTNVLQKPSKVAMVRITRPLKFSVYVMQHLMQTQYSENVLRILLIAIRDHTKESNNTLLKKFALEV